ncbi:non-homologous end-joining DNA ligase [Actinosynnema sp. NPDC047251]|uniref:DNA ligase (ATP) n=1 Tax=Saccharothrix espanaensis (strain ATCC 51144 / DSM 44229 / JCM 9112 / NBRC 15066 / NRRL 15764) TaxID=1179773 RepID=K0K408_SACES|nr:non-homologous end-joining DNA ligase [Saccharothrix espanaensis]CCH31574.1 putative DNA ligase [Saccharothrix espanaensis DSM 44229]
MSGDLSEYRSKRVVGRTPEPLPAVEALLPRGSDDTFVIQEHHASSLHWDVRLERGGVLVSWAVPKGLPAEPGTIRLAVRTEDHPVEYASFEGVIPKGEYGAGRMFVWDRGRYETVKWSDREVDVVLHGSRIEGEFVFFRRGSSGGGGSGRDWMVRRRHEAVRPDWVALPEWVEPMLATAASGLPARPEEFAFEFKWDGVRAVARVEGGRLRLVSRSGVDITAVYPELQGLGGALGSTQVLLDGEVVAFAGGRPSFGALQQRLQASAAQARRLAARVPVTFLVFDVLHLDGASTVGLPYARRRELLEGLGLVGPHWLVPRAFPGAGAEVLAASREQGLEGVVAKRLDSRYVPGVRSAWWLKITDVAAQEVVIGGWRPGGGRRAGLVGSLLLGVPDGAGLVFVGSVGTGFGEAELPGLTERLRGLEVSRSPFSSEVPRERARGARWVRPVLVGEVVHRQWTAEGRMRFPTWRGLRPDRVPEEVRRGGGDGGAGR